MHQPAAQQNHLPLAIYYYCNFLLLLCCDPLDRAEHGAYIVRLVYVYVALLKRDKTCTCTLLN